MSPRIDSIETVGIQRRAEPGQIRRLNTRQEARFKRNAGDRQTSCHFYEVFQGNGPFGAILLRIDFSEKTMEAVAVDADLHDLRGYHRPTSAGSFQPRLKSSAGVAPTAPRNAQFNRGGASMVVPTAMKTMVA